MGNYGEWPWWKTVLWVIFWIVAGSIGLLMLAANWPPDEKTQIIIWIVVFLLVFRNELSKRDDAFRRQHDNVMRQIASVRADIQQINRTIGRIEAAQNSLIRRI